MKKAQKYTAAYIIAFHFGWDVRDVSECRYQSTRFAAPASYVLDGDYYCCPSGSQKPPQGWEWAKIGTHYDRDIWRAAA